MNPTTETPSWSVYPAHAVPVEVVEYYFQKLYMHDWLKYRFYNMLDPRWADIKLIIATNRHMYLVFDKTRGEFAGEFSLENFTGKAAQVHFSMHPENPPSLSRRLASEVSDYVLNVWQRSDGSSFLDAVYGITPVKHRAACRFIQQCGFKKQFILPSGASYFGEYTDALVSLKVRS